MKLIQSQKLHYLNLRRISPYFKQLIDYTKYEQDKNQSTINNFRLGVSTFSVFSGLKYARDYLQSERTVYSFYLRRKYFDKLAHNRLKKKKRRVVKANLKQFYFEKEINLKFQAFGALVIHKNQNQHRKNQFKKAEKFYKVSLQSRVFRSLALNRVFNVSYSIYEDNLTAWSLQKWKNWANNRKSVRKMNLNIAQIYRAKQLKIKAIVALNRNVCISSLFTILEKRADQFRQRKLKAKFLNFWKISIQVLNQVIYASLVKNFARKREKLVKIKVLLALKMNIQQKQKQKNKLGKYSEGDRRNSGRLNGLKALSASSEEDEILFQLGQSERRRQTDQMPPMKGLKLDVEELNLKY